GDGRDYRGKLDYTTDGTTCQMWASRYPQQHKFYTGNPMKDVRNGIGEHNYCRNPNGRRAKPWCFVPLSPGSDLPRWQYCDVEPCKK
ncbi:hypothetical protein CAPTEDRAFT_145843, partial [Capitella teleta]|uniref:Kringle domain-containing protein n=1 Tax=Capitella teleta TaxID=283909 RepID=X1Z4D9_CAPTE